MAAEATVNPLANLEIVTTTTPPSVTGTFPPTGQEATGIQGRVISTASQIFDTQIVEKGKEEDKYEHEKDHISN